MFRDSLHDLFASGPFSRKKYLDKIFKILFKSFWPLILATCLLVFPVAKIMCFAQIGLNPRQFSKTFQFFLALRAPSLSCPPLPLPKPPFSLKKPPFSSSILHQSLRIGMSFLLFSIYFKFPTLVFFGFCIMLRYGNKVFEYGFVDVLMSLIYEFCWFC